MGEGFPVVFAQKNKSGIGGQAKRFFPETVKFEVHQRIPRDLSISSKKGEDTEAIEFFWNPASYYKQSINSAF